MKTQNRSIKKHLFICNNARDCGDYCHSQNSERLIRSLKLKLREDDKWEEYKVTSSGCLGPCAQGISAVLYPDDLLITELSEDSFHELYELLIKD